LTEETSRELSKEAELQSVSFSALTTTILTKYLEYERYTERYGIINFSHSTFTAILNALSDETVEKLSKDRGINRTKDMLASLGLDPTLRNTVLLLEKYVGKHSNWFDCTVLENQDGLHIHLSHHLNRKWSIFLAHYVSNMFREFGFKPAEITINQSTVSLRLVRRS